jgi:hypothetical protein
VPAGRFNSVANWATVVTAMQWNPWGVLLQAVRACKLRDQANQCSRAFRISALAALLSQPGHLGQFVHGQVGQLVARVHIAFGELVAIKSCVTPSRSRRSCDTSSSTDSSLERFPSSAATSLARARNSLHGVLVEGLDLEHLGQRHVGHFLEAEVKPSAIRMSATSSSTSSFSTKSLRKPPVFLGLARRGVRRPT